MHNVLKKAKRTLSNLSALLPRNWSIKLSLADKLTDILVYMADKDNLKTAMIVDRFGFTETTAKRYLRQITEFGYLEATGGNRNRQYIKKR